jgi:hypothetical protein
MGLPTAQYFATEPVLNVLIKMTPFLECGNSFAAF